MKTNLRMGQTKLFDGDKNKRIELGHLINTFRIENEYDKMIVYFGNVYSKIMILGEAPTDRHINKTDSYSCFCFDLEHEEPSSNKLSGDILIKVFNEINMDVSNFYWDNVFKLPIETLSDEEKTKHKQLLKQTIDLIKPELIICLGNNAHEQVKKFLYNYNIRKIEHPAYILRNPKYFGTYRDKFKELLENGQ